MADEVSLPRSVPDILTPMAEETSAMLDGPPEIESSPNPSVDILPPTDEDATGESTIVPHKFRQDRPSIGDWMGTWWVKGKPRASEIGRDPPPTEQTPNGVSNRSANRRRSAKSVFGTLGISILNPVPSASTQFKRRPTIIDDAAASSDNMSIKSGRSSYTHAESTFSTAVSLVSSPIQPSFLPSPAAPLISTVFDSLAPSHTLSKPSSSNEDPPPVMMQGATLRAIANATRVMTTDPGSILTDQGNDTSSLIARLALDLIKNARDDGITFRDRPKERRDVSRASDYFPESTGNKSGIVATMSAGTGAMDAAMTLNRTLSASQADSASKAKPKPKARTGIMQAAPTFASPLFGSFMNQQQRKPSALSGSGAVGSDQGSSTVNAQRTNAQTSTSTTSAVSSARKAPSVPLESIIPATAKPPTHYLSRTYTPLTARDFRFSIPLPQSACRYTIYHDDKNQRPLTDQYGFMYDVSQYDVLLLIRAKECRNTAPACLTGVKIADREEDNSWPDDDDDDMVPAKGNIDIVKESCPCDGESDPRSFSPTSFGAGDSQSISVKSRSSSKSRRRSSIMTSGAVSSQMVASTTSILSVNSDTPRHACANTVRRLLNQLTEIHNIQQAAQRKEWDAFVKQRSKVKLLRLNTNAPSGSSVSAFTGVGGAAAAILGLGTEGEEDELSHSEGLIGFAQLGLSSSKDERREFGRLVRKGIPLVYRSKVWMECSGALEMKEPGLFQDLLAQAEGSDGVTHEIEKDVGRTMPLNIFFGGDGAGVDKLRRVLVAYSR